ncbi:MAG: ABC transporter ATP-binding protein [Syntrophomonadaceae bacterium]|jgi:NitT/TauT family transport system ATP-binding protein|nr:ABC transporter ATP-binding protein [Bacillota bacterium]NLP23831.1 ABC transporter ATP-binding protein [Syntrophomonadaceae bacterium]
MYRLSDVSLSFGSLKVLENFSAEFGCNQFTCLFGPSGIGKSTILNLLSGLIKPDSGEVSVTNATIGYVFQDTRLLPWCTVRENMEIGLYAANVPKIRRDNIVNSMIERLGLAGFTDYYPNQLSGGMKQRVALGRAFVVDPQLLLLDEPFSGLDEALKMEMRNLLNELISWHPCTTVFVTHDFMEAVQLADKVLLLKEKPCSVPTVYPIDSDRRCDLKYIQELESVVLGGG